MAWWRRWAVAVVAGGLALAPLPALARDKVPTPPCSGNPAEVHRLDIGSTYGFYAVPKKKPAGLVMFDHGYGHNAEDWKANLERTAQRDGVIAVAMNYVAAEGAKAGGWRVSEGAGATVA